ncbi:MAG: hypothetical protein K0U93_02890 [Gammaproteobacteria bacterium]|nr:hypothetical protein [Gammaproteobacteria bacterium]
MSNSRSRSEVRVADSITKMGPEFRGSVLVAGSHGGKYCGYLAALGGLSGVILNDAGVGRDNAGIGALAYLEALGVPGATISHRSARIGDGADMMARGVISERNGPAAEQGCEVGMACALAAEKLGGAPGYEGAAPEYPEARFELPRAGVREVVGCDSASLVKSEDDAGRILITGSHGGILAARPQYGVAAPAFAAVFNDAGVGIDEAGLRRLDVLEANGVIGATVDAFSARIGDARSAWEDGLLSFINASGHNAGLDVGMTLREMVSTLAEHSAS